jgi:uncharacterized protein
VAVSAWLGLVATCFVAALLQAASGFGFAVIATPLFLLFVPPDRAVQLVIILTAVLSAVVLPGLGRAVARGLLLRLLLGSLAGLPLGLAAFRLADPLLVRRVIGAIVLAFAVFLWLTQRGVRAEPRFAATPAGDVGAGAVSGVLTAMIGMSGPPVLLYLLAAGTAPRTVRATLLAFFAVCYTVALASHAAVNGVPGATWRIAACLVPCALVGGYVGRPLGDRLGPDAFTSLALALLVAAGLYSLAAPAR